MERNSSLWRREASWRSTATNAGCEDDDNNDYVEVGEDEDGVKDGDDDDGGKLEIHPQTPTKVVQQKRIRLTGILKIMSKLVR